MSYAKGKNFNVVFLPLRYSAGDTYRGSGLVFVDLDGCHKCVVALLYNLKIACLVFFRPRSIAK